MSPLKKYLSFCTRTNYLKALSHLLPNGLTVSTEEKWSTEHQTLGIHLAAFAAKIVPMVYQTTFKEPGIEGDLEMGKQKSMTILMRSSTSQ